MADLNRSLLQRLTCRREETPLQEGTVARRNSRKEEKSLKGGTIIRRNRWKEETSRRYKNRLVTIRKHSWQYRIKNLDPRSSRLSRNSVAMKKTKSGREAIYKELGDES